MRLHSKTTLAHLGSGASHLVLLYPKQYPVQFGAKPRCPTVPVSVFSPSVWLCSKNTVRTKRRPSAWNHPFRPPPSSQGSQSTPLMHLCKIVFLKWLEEQHLFKYVSHCQRKNSKAFVRPAGKLRNGRLKIPGWRFRVPSGSSD